VINTAISKRLLLSIFNKDSPLHDGAVILYRGKIVAARCILPVSEQDHLPETYGPRHRAALGISEVSDSLVLVVSEESGQMSIARNGNMMQNLSAQELRATLNNYLFEVSGTKISEKTDTASKSDQDQKVAQA
jgi:DNA integrity scanning protein DisA with diadenylate cyclase activity